MNSFEETTLDKIREVIRTVIAWRACRYVFRNRFSAYDVIKPEILGGMTGNNTKHRK